VKTLKDLSERIHKLEKEAAEKAKVSKTFDDNFEMSYFSGLLNGFNLAMYVINGGEGVEDLFKRVSHQETKN
jgi:hypothetical protein